MFTAVFAFDAVFPMLPEWGIYSPPRSITLSRILGVSYGPLAVSFGAVVLLMMAIVNRFDPAQRFEEESASRRSFWSREWGWAATGTMGGLIILAASAQDQYLGISRGVLSVAAYVTDLFGYSLRSIPTLNDSVAWSAALVAGLFPGSTVSALISGSFRPTAVTPLWGAAFSSGIAGRSAAVFTGGFMIIFGALIGGGCTAGAFMSGFPTLSLGSMVTGMTFFGTAMATAFLLYWGRWQLVTEVKSRGIDLATD